METKKDILASLKQSKYINLIPVLKEEKAQAFYSVVLTLIAVSLCIYFAINTTVSIIIQLSKQLDDSKLIEQKLIQKITNLQTLQQKYIALAPNLPLLDAALPNIPKVPPFQGQLLAIAKKSNITITQLQTSQVELLTTKAAPKPTVKVQQPATAQQSTAANAVAPGSPQGGAPAFSAVTPTAPVTPSFGFSAGTDGTYKNTVDFLSTVVNFERIATIDSFSLKAGKDKNDIWKLTVSGKAYYYIQ